MKKNKLKNGYLAILLLLSGMLLPGSRSFAQNTPEIYVNFYVLIDRDFTPSGNVGRLIVFEGYPHFISLNNLGPYYMYEVHGGSIMLPAKNLYNTYNPNAITGMEIICESPNNLNPFENYPIGGDALSIIDDPSSQIDEDIPYIICTQGDESGMGATLTYRARRVYEMATPSKLSFAAANQTICAYQQIDLTPSAFNLRPTSSQLYTVTTDWEYQVTGGEWQHLNTTTTDVLSLRPEDALPEVKTGKQTVRFRYRHVAAYTNATHYSLFSTPSEPVEILPSAPTVAINNIQQFPSCAGQPTGSIKIEGNAINGGFTQIRWLLRNGNVSQPCDPAAAPGQPNACGNLDRSSNGAVPVAGGVTIDGLSPGDYTLWLLNPGGDAGNCFSPYPVKITERPPLTLAENTAAHVDVSCYSGNDGSISAIAGGSDVSNTYAFTLLSSANIIVRPEAVAAGQSMTWNNLPAGTYKVEGRNNACSAVTERTGDITVSQPIRLTGALVSTSPRCISPGDGSITVTAAGIASGYQFNLYNNGTLVKQSGVVTADNYTFSNLPGGTYRAEIVNNDVPLCPKWDSTVTMTTLNPLTISFVSKDSVSCFGGNDGRVTVSAAGGTGTYTFTLSGNGQNKINSTGIFTGLPAGNYTITVKNQGSTCNDQSSLNVTVSQRAVLNIQLQQEAPGCYPNTTALIKAIVTGGSGTYSYNWQQLKNGIWTSDPFWFSTFTQIDDLSAGTYRVIVTDGKATGCTVVSAESIVVAVSEVKITKVTVQDAVCLADGARIVVTATGGSGGYYYEYSLDGNSWHTFTAATALITAGDYRVRASDAQGCTAVDPGTYKVTLPSAPVDFTIVYSNYNGYNISCKGNNNGYVQITATGGNGGSYSGYTYALDNGAYGTVSKLENIRGGIHQVHVKDARGCIRTQQINLTEPVAVLGLRVTEKEHLGCGVEPIGHITVAPDGGSAPYTYAIDNGAWQNGTTFSNVTAGEHTLSVKDGAGCITSTTTTLTAAYVPLSATADLTDVKCAGESNGAITIHVNGGDGNYTYQWNTLSSSVNVVKDLPAGTYTVDVSDSKTCTQTFSYTIHQPEPLALKLNATSICEGATDGSIDAIVSGGTEPYRYSLDQSSWLNAGSFNGLSEGKYQMTVQDAHGCEVRGEATIGKSNIKPEVNFLVASRRNAFDTLIMKDISLPEPDNISWAYDPAATLLGIENGTPEIKFTNPGTYWIEMTATFGACTYTVRKELQIGAYDPQAGPGYSMPVHVIDTVMLSPNPNNGNFSFRIKLNHKQQIVAYVYDMNGIIAGKKQYAPALQVDDNFSVAGTATGTFIFRVITESESKDVRFIISR